MLAYSCPRLVYTLYPSIPAIIQVEDLDRPSSTVQHDRFFVATHCKLLAWAERADLHICRLPVKCPSGCGERGSVYC